MAQRLYRSGIDAAEKFSIGWADRILCNSQYTLENICNFCNKGPTFRAKLEVLYPTVAIERNPESTAQRLDGKYFLSLNRLDKRKNFGLAVSAFAEFLKMNHGDQRFRLVIAGGFNSNDFGNRECYEDLRFLATGLGVLEKVEFRFNFTDDEKVSLIEHSICLLYTP